MQLDRSSALPLHYQLERELRDAIEHGDIAPGDAIPSEPQLSRLAGISRPTVRQAIDQLVHEGLLRRERGRGTFVSDRALHVRLAPDAPGGTALRAISPGTRVRPLRIERSAAPDEVRQRLALLQHDEVIEVTGLRMANSTPVAHVRAYVAARLGSGVEFADFVDRSLTEVFELRSGLRVSRGELLVSAATVEPEVAELLRTPPGDAALCLEVVVFAGEQPLACSRTIVPAERRRFRFDLSREQVIDG